MQLDFAKLHKRLDELTTVEGISVVALSGFAGSGKSTLAKRLVNDIDGAAVVSTDDFSIGRQAGRCDDWRSIDRHRLTEEVLIPARQSEQISYRMYDWQNDRLGEHCKLGTPKLVVVEGIGLIHPTLMNFFDFTVWIDCPIETASQRGKYRDREIYKVDHDRMWQEVWTPNDHDYSERFHPDELVDAIYAPPE